MQLIKSAKLSPFPPSLHLTQPDTGEPGSSLKMADLDAESDFRSGPLQSLCLYLFLSESLSDIEGSDSGSALFEIIR